VQPEDVSSLFDADFLHGGAHPLALGLTDQIAWFVGQDRVTYKRVGLIDPLSLKDYESHGGLVGLRKAITQSGSDIVAEVTASGLRGRGGAGFPAGIKWKTVLDAQADQKYVCCNADEGDSGTFADRILIEADPFTLIEGMAIAAVAVGATQGFVYLRSEYPTAITRLRDAIAIAEGAGVLGSSVLVLMCAVKRLQCLKVLKVSAVLFVQSHRYLQLQVSLENPQLLITFSLLQVFLQLSLMALLHTQHAEQVAHSAHRFSSWLATLLAVELLKQHLELP